MNIKTPVRVTPVTTPISHDGILHQIGEEFDALWMDVKDLVEAGIAKIKENAPDSEPVSIKAGKKKDK